MRKRSHAVLPLLLLVCSSVDALAQRFEAGTFLGGSWFSRPGFTLPSAQSPFFGDRVDYKFADGGVWGVRAREALSTHWGLEQSYTLTGTQNAVFDQVAVGMRTHHLYFNGTFTGGSMEAKIRPYLSGGFGWSYFNPTDEGVAEAEPFINGPRGNAFDSTSETAWNFGGGLKWRVSHRFVMDFSFRDFVHDSPAFNLPGAIDKDLDNNTQLQAGFMMAFGGGKPLLAHNFTVAPAIESSTSNSLCPGESTTLRIAASDSIAGNDITYKWTASGHQVSTDHQYTFVAPADPGPIDVGVQVYYDTGTLTKEERKAVEKNRGVPVDRKTTINVKSYQAPTAVAAVDRPSVQRGERVHLTSSATGSECSGNLAYRWSASDGRMMSSTDTSSADFDGSSLAFNDAIKGQQCKPVTVSLEVTDQRGGVARDAKNIQVCYIAPEVAAPPPPPPPPPPPTAVQLSDINFGKNSARVNNCAKRVLGNELYPQLTSSRYSDYDVVLVGHRDVNEPDTTGKKPVSSLDRDRVLNAAAFLTARGATCKDLELTRVKAVWKGAEQNNDFRANFCEGSAVAISSADQNAKNRRVEIWLVPKGTNLSEIGTVQASGDDIAALACPK